MYECRICRTIFRSLANFILHKRNYCRSKFKVYVSNCRDHILLEKLHPQEPPEEQKIDSNSDRVQLDKQGPAAKSLTPVIEKLKEKQEIKQLMQELLVTDLSNQTSTDDKDEEKSIVAANDLLLEEIASNNAAVFQTVLRSLPQSDGCKPEFMKSEVMEIHGILDSDEAVLGNDGKICNFQTNKLKTNPNVPKTYLICTECNMRFSTKKTLSFHLKNKHNDTRLVYVCPDCKETFSNSWCVYRHLYKVHRKTIAQVKRLREQVHNSMIRKDQDTNKKSDKKESSNLDKTDEENQWLNNIEGDKDFQMCGGCGKRFERKAALHSHAAMCTKRIAVCNTIKDNAKKKEESKDVKNKVTNNANKSSVPESQETLKGASKRKPYLLRTYKQPPIDNIPKREPACDTVPCDSKPVLDEKDCDMQTDEQVSSKSKPRKNSSDSDRKSETSDRKSDTSDLCTTITLVDDHEVSSVNDKNETVMNKICDDDNSNCSTSKGSSDNVVLNKLDKKRVDHGQSHLKDGECFCSSPARLDSEKMLNIIASSLTGIIPNERIELLKEGLPSPSCQSQEKCHNASEFDLFCQKVAEHMLKIQDDPEKSSTPSLEEVGTKSTEESIGNVSEFQSPGKISIRSLEELRGFPKEQQTTETIIDEEMPVLELSVTPKSPKKSPRRLAKRKRTSSLDSIRTHKTFKQSNFDVLLDKQDLNFMAKASPHMDRARLTCKSCQSKHTSLSKLLWHMSAHFSWFRFQCSRCSFVSFGKSECAAHAKDAHEIRTDEISSVVLPIPNWKTLLMSNEFRELKNDDDFGGKHTDEVKPCCQNETSWTDDNEDDPAKNLIDTLFVDSEVDEVDFTDIHEIESFPMPITNEISSVKNVSIDVTENEQEHFQLEVPQEIYTLDVFEVINIDENEPRRPVIKEEIEDGAFLLPNCSTASPELIEGAKLECEEVKHSATSLTNNRPTRNRMRSIKTLQNDFFYDLGRVVKREVDGVTKTNGPQKQKKQNSGSNVSKRDKEMRVYTKNK